MGFIWGLFPFGGVSSSFASPFPLLFFFFGELLGDPIFLCGGVKNFSSFYSPGFLVFPFFLFFSFWWFFSRGVPPGVFFGISPLFTKFPVGGSPHFGGVFLKGLRLYEKGGFFAPLFPWGGGFSSPGGKKFPGRMNIKYFFPLLGGGKFPFALKRCVFPLIRKVLK